MVHSGFWGLSAPHMVRSLQGWRLECMGGLRLLGVQMPSVSHTCSQPRGEGTGGRTDMHTHILSSLPRSSFSLTKKLMEHTFLSSFFLFWEPTYSRWLWALATGPRPESVRGWGRVLSRKSSRHRTQGEEKPCVRGAGRQCRRLLLWGPFPVLEGKSPPPCPPAPG